MLLSSKPLKDIFFCPEESNFYAHSIETLVLNNCLGSESIVEFGSGDGSPVIQALLRTNFEGVIHGFELNRLASEAAQAKIDKYKVSQHYKIHNKCLFDASQPKAEFLISNPPYLPALDNNIYQPLLHGGIDGITVTKKLLELGYTNVLVMASSYSNPIGLINYARSIDYSVSNFIVSPLKFGYYSSEPKVKNWIVEMQKSNLAFYSSDIYLLAGVLFTKQQKNEVDLSTELLQLLTAL